MEIIPYVATHGSLNLKYYYLVRRELLQFLFDRAGTLTDEEPKNKIARNIAHRADDRGGYYFLFMIDPAGAFDDPDNWGKYNGDHCVSMRVACNYEAPCCLLDHSSSLCAQIRNYFGADLSRDVDRTTGELVEGHAFWGMGYKGTSKREEITTEFAF